MDWIDGILQKLKLKLNRSSLKKTLLLYIIVAVVFVALCWAATITFCESWIRVIANKYHTTVENNVVVSYWYGIAKEDEQLLRILTYVQRFSVFFYVVLAMILIAHFYYKNKIAEPLRLLKKEIYYINRNDLSLDCSYSMEDEMGEICRMFNKMRLQLVAKQDSIWDMMEGQRQLNSAFAHDLRTPLTVMQGYTDLLMKYYPQGKISEEKLMDTIALLQAQVIRLKDFSETMKGMNHFDELTLKPSEVESAAFHTKVAQMIEGLQVHQKAEIRLDDRISLEKLWVDEAVVLQVMENLMSNALSYCRSLVEIRMEMEEERLVIYVRDDGSGFSEKELFTADRPYYCGRPDKDKSGHYGLGLSICKLLCQKHGGKLALCNSTSGGAIVCASFYAR